jgi:23S rRNA (uracil1939-C5)-methyltransferase
VDRFAKVVGIEWSEAASRRAMESAAPNESHLSGAVEVHLPELLATSTSSDTTLIVDPPAEGLAPDVLRAIMENPPERLVYVSCDPSTFSRDTKQLAAAAAYALAAVQPVDMFPQTAEIELAALFKRDNPPRD